LFPDILKPMPFQMIFAGMIRNLAQRTVEITMKGKHL